MLNWDSAARRYVADNTAVSDVGVETFGPLHMYGAHEPDSDNTPPFVEPDVRVGDFMQTYTGRKFWPLDPRADEVDIHDIAHALSMLCRYGGHCRRFFSVAEHSVLMARWVAEHSTPQDALWALLHDASEAYIADVPRPLKRHLPGYKEAEERVMAAVCDRFGLPHAMPEIVHEADNRILADEVRQNMRPMDWHAKHDDPLGVRLGFWEPEFARASFLAERKRCAEIARTTYAKDAFHFELGTAVAERIEAGE